MVNAIFQLTASDFDEWKQLRMEAVSNHPESFGESLEEIRKQDRQWFVESLQKGTIFCYLKDERMVGLVGTFTMQPGNMRHRAVMFGLYVGTEHRRQGIADAMVEHVIKYVAPTHRQIHLTVTTNNHAAIVLYQKHDFVIYGTEPDALCIGDHYYDEYLMCRML